MNTWNVTRPATNAETANSSRSVVHQSAFETFRNTFSSATTERTRQGGNTQSYTYSHEGDRYSYYSYSSGTESGSTKIHYSNTDSSDFISQSHITDYSSVSAQSNSTGSSYSKKGLITSSATTTGGTGSVSTTISSSSSSISYLATTASVYATSIAATTSWNRQDTTTENLPATVWTSTAITYYYSTIPTGGSVSTISTSTTGSITTTTKTATYLTNATSESFTFEDYTGNPDEGDWGFTEGSATNLSPYTVASNSSFVRVTDVLITITGAIDVGTVISAYDEWAWTFTGSGTGAITDVATSFTQTTMWPSYSVNPIAWVSLNAPIETKVIPEKTYQRLAPDNISMLTDEITITELTGSFLPRGTSTYTSNKYTTVSSSYEIGTTPSFSANATSVRIDSRGTVESYRTVTRTMFSGRDSVTVSLKQVYAVASTTQEVVGNGQTVVGMSTETYSLLGQDQLARGTTEMSYGETLGGSYGYGGGAGGPAGSGLAYQRVERKQGWQSPASYGKSAQVGTNLGMGSVYYPWVSSVAENVMIPVAFTHGVSTTQYDSEKTRVLADSEILTDSNGYSTTSTYDDITTWSFSWSLTNVSWTSMGSSTQNSSGSVITTVRSTSNSTVPEVQGDNRPELFWEDGKDLVGGYSPYPVNEIYQFSGGAKVVTFYNTTGGSTVSTITTTGTLIQSLSQTLSAHAIIGLYSAAGAGTTAYGRNQSF